MTSEDEVLVQAKLACTSCVPGWLHLPQSDIRLTPISGGITNKVFRAESPAPASPRFALVRIYGRSTHLFFDRDQEIANFRTLASLRVAPNLLGTFPWGRIEEYLFARPLTDEEVRDPRFARVIAQQVASFHAKPLRPLAAQKAGPRWLKCVRKWMSAVKWNGWSRSWVDSQIEWVLRRLGCGASDSWERDDDTTRFTDELVFCHNDLLSGNLLVEEGEELESEPEPRIHIIDFEYAAVNPRGFDLANHFCEYAGFDAEVAALPTREQQCNFLRAYMGVYCPNAVPEPRFLDAILDRLIVYSVASDIFWGVWALLQSQHSTIEFDFSGYSRRRLVGLLGYHRQLDFAAKHQIERTISVCEPSGSVDTVPIIASEDTSLD